ncbi:MAG: phosphate acyltransferase PlsX [Oscillospiraceae bacterium]|nr:phosphate acyltransferase PlsX [Oscillospiraceae bacterium]
MKIIIDAMGGDNAPREIVRGALLANSEFGVNIILVGRGEEILQVLKDDGVADLPQGIEIAHAEQVVTMEDNASAVMKEKPESSMLVALRLLAEGKGDAFITAGSTGALLTSATLIVKRIKGVRRGALVPTMPTPDGCCILIDCGANVEVTEEYMLQFAYLGSAYSKLALGIPNPRVGLLNNGVEEKKGPPLYRNAYKMLKNAADINFVGNIEAREAVLGGADVIVADGFAGNIYLKAAEGAGVFFGGMIKRMFKRNLLTKFAALLCYKDIKAFKDKMDYRETGGAPLLGMSKPILKAHGSSDARAVRGAVRQAVAYAKCGFAEHIAGQMDTMKALIAELSAETADGGAEKP